MAKANSGKVIRMLSPGNYIRNKARTLPLYECLVNTGWEKSKMVHVVVARRHPNGNLTACFYLVDLMCLGVKDSFYMFNIPIHEYKEKIKIIGEGLDMRPVSYELAHNIVFASLEFAEEFGFSPHKDFTSITCFMLEEDTDNIELLEIECGFDGKPAYIRSPFDNQAKVNNIIARLEKTAGPGNYIIIDEEDDQDMKDFDDDYDDEDDDDEFSGNTFEEKREIFQKLYKKFDSLSPDEIKRFSNVTSSVFYDLCDPVLIDEYYDEFAVELDIDIIDDDEIPDELLGIKPGNIANFFEIKELFIEAYNSLGGKPKNARKKWNTFRAKAKDIPAVAFLELELLRIEESEEYTEKLKIYSSKYKNYPMIRLLWLSEQILSKDLSDETLFKEINRETIFTGRQSLHSIELFNYLLYIAYSIEGQDNPSRIEALFQVLNDFDIIPDNDLVVLIPILLLMKANYVIDYLK